MEMDLNAIAQIAATLLAGTGRVEHSEADIKRAVNDASRIIDAARQRAKQRAAGPEADDKKANAHAAATGD
ncbi:MAG TPA: hypothetical protein VJN70_01005 [Gemmatimonadaceae bacterium]|nr:hypothetical protein [Gemmatimonadaceae bacterium]